MKKKIQTIEDKVKNIIISWDSAKEDADDIVYFRDCQKHQIDELLDLFARREEEVKRELEDKITGLALDEEYKPIYDEQGNQIVLRGVEEDAIAHRWYVTGVNKTVGKVISLLAEGKIKEYNLSATRNNIFEEEKVIGKSKLNG